MFSKMVIIIYNIENMDDAQPGLNIFKNENTLSDLKYVFAYELSAIVLYSLVPVQGYSLIAESSYANTYFESEGVFSFLNI